MSAPLLAVSVALYAGVAYDLWQRGVFTSMWWTGWAFFLGIIYLTPTAKKGSYLLP